MSNLWTSLSSAGRALEAQRFGLDIAGQNIANVNTPGYTRRTVDLAAVAPQEAHSAGGGVDAVRLRSFRDELIERRLRQEQPAVSREAAVADLLAVIEVALGSAGQSIDARLSGFFDAFSRLADDPLSGPARQEVIVEARGLGDALRAVARALGDAARDADLRIRRGIEEVNALATRIARANQQVMGIGETAPQALHLRDDATEAIRQLSEMLDVSTIQRPDGAADVTFGNGRPLVIGGTAYAITTPSQPPSGYAPVQTGDTDATGEIAGGSLGGWVRVRDVLVPDYLTRLDQIAYELSQRVNAVHDAGFDATGVDAGNFFTPIASVAGAASLLVVDPTISADVKRLAAAGVAALGDNQAARSMAALRDVKALDGASATLLDGWANLVYRVGRDAKTAQDEHRGRGEVLGQLESLRDAVSGVSLDEEAVTMLKFQRAYEANARFFRAIDDTLATLLDLMGR